MARFYFHIRHGRALLSDVDGIDFPNSKAAATHAQEMARRLRNQCFRDQSSAEEHSIDLSDENGQVIETVNIVPAFLGRRRDYGR